VNLAKWRIVASFLSSCNFSSRTSKERT